jgi:hypothetical protein
MLGLLQSLTLAQIHAALAHGLANPEETEQALRDEEQAATSSAEENPISAD